MCARDEMAVEEGEERVDVVRGRKRAGEGGGSSWKGESGF